MATSNLYHIKVPSYYIGKRYGKLFDNLTTRRFMIPLGLYRTGRVDLNDYKPTDAVAGAVPYKPKSGDKDEESNYKEFNYVVTNPDGDTTKLEKTDLVFVLAK